MARNSGRPGGAPIDPLAPRSHGMDLDCGPVHACPPGSRIQDARSWCSRIQQVSGGFPLTPPLGRVAAYPPPHTHTHWAEEG